MKRFWLYFDWLMVLLFVILGLPILIAMGRAIARAMKEE